MKPRWLVTLLLVFSLHVTAQTMNHAKLESEELMNAVMPFAQQMLEREGGFLPYGGATKPSGEIVMVGGYDGNEHPPANDIIQLIKQGFIQSAKNGEYKATALVYDVRVALPLSEEKSDAIAVSLNHKDNYSVIVLFPYTLHNNKLSFGEPFAQYGEADVFPLSIY